jgi:NADH dehydrogenase FAD-containing subunit
VSLSRRDIIKTSAALATLLFTTSSSASQTAKKTLKNKVKSKKAPLPKAEGPRVVIVGGGWSGLSVAKNLKTYAPKADVILVEQRDIFLSCPASNSWLVDKVDTDFLIHDYLQAARNYNYLFFHATATGVDKKSNILHTSRGDIDYDYLVLAPGIDYDYSCWNVDSELENRLRMQYPAAMKAGNEHFTLKQKIKNFKGGNFIITVPSGNYRCLPAPYERACIIADYMKHNNIKGKVIILDENNDITIKPDGFHSAFKELYKDYIQWEPNAKLESIDLDKKMVTTEFDEYKFEDAIFYPHVRGARILEIAGVAKDSVFNKLEANINQFTYEAVGYPNIFISGDARPMGFSKSGNTSNTEGEIVAKRVAAKINKKPDPKWASPTTLCISEVQMFPKERGIFITTQYHYIKEEKTFDFYKSYSQENWKGKEGLVRGESLYDWANALYLDMFGNEG